SEEVAGAAALWDGTVHSVVGAWVKIGGGGAMSGSSGSGTYSSCPSALRSAVEYASGPSSSRAERNTVWDSTRATTAISTTPVPTTDSTTARFRFRLRSPGSPRVTGPEAVSKSGRSPLRPGADWEKSGRPAPGGCGPLPSRFSLIATSPASRGSPTPWGSPRSPVILPPHPRIGTPGPIGTLRPFSTPRVHGDPSATTARPDRRRFRFGLRPRDPGRPEDLLRPGRLRGERGQHDLRGQHHRGAGHPLPAGRGGPQPDRRSGPGPAGRRHQDRVAGQRRSGRGGLPGSADPSLADGSDRPGPRDGRGRWQRADLGRRRPCAAHLPGAPGRRA